MVRVRNSAYPLAGRKLSTIMSEFLTLNSELYIMNNAITITVNGFTERVPAGVTLSELIDCFEERDVHLIVEHNQRFVYPQEYETTRVAAGDTVEFINPNIGG